MVAIGVVKGSDTGPWMFLATQVRVKFSEGSTAVVLLKIPEPHSPEFHMSPFKAFIFTENKLSLDSTGGRTGTIINTTVTTGPAAE